MTPAARSRLIIGSKMWSSWSLRPWLLMRQFHIPFEELTIRLRTPQTAGDIARVSPSGKIPVLVDDGLVVWDTLAIFEHLAERHPEAGIWPRDAAARSIARAVCAEMHSGFVALRQNCPMDFTARGLTPADPSAITADVARILTLWADCRGRFGANGPFLFGAFCAADAMFAPVVSRFVTYGIDVSGHLDEDPDQGTVPAYMAAVMGLDGWEAWGIAAAAERSGD